MTSPDPSTPPSAAAATTWRPLAEGALAASLASAVRRIADALAEPLAAWLPAGAPPDQQQAADLSLAGGAAGQAVLQGYLERALGDARARDRAARCLERATAGVAHVDLEPSLFSGFTGVAWAVEHLARAAGAPDDDALDDIDEALCAHLASGGPSHYDLVSGLVGLAVYALERRPRPRADELLRLTIDRLDERAERTADGITWRTPSWVALAPGFALGPYDLGLAHGTPGVIAMLAAASLQGVEVERARALLANAVRWVRAQRLPAGAASAYASSAGPGAGGAVSRLAWCYGDLGIACALLLAARAAGERAWEDEAIALATRAGARAPEAGQVRDAPLCHGAAGVAHLLNRLHQATGAPALADAARRWLERALAWQEAGSGIGGFRSWAPRESATGSWVDDPGLLAGTAGIGLVFAAAMSPIEPEWDRLLLLSTRSGAAR